jgi:hypothetical protein
MVGQEDSSYLDDRGGCSSGWRGCKHDNCMAGLHYIDLGQSFVQMRLHIASMRQVTRSRASPPDCRTEMRGNSIIDISRVTMLEAFLASQKWFQIFIQCCRKLVQDIQILPQKRIEILGTDLNDRPLYWRSGRGVGRRYSNLTATWALWKEGGHFTSEFVVVSGSVE